MDSESEKPKQQKSNEHVTKEEGEVTLVKTRAGKEANRLIAKQELDVEVEVDECPDLPPSVGRTGLRCRANRR